MSELKDPAATNVKSTVSYSIGFTRNMGDFESLRIDMGVTDAPRGDEKVSEAFNRVKDFVEGQLLDNLASIEKDIKAQRDAIRDGENYKRQVKKAADEGK